MKLENLEQNYNAWHTLFESGEITYEEFVTRVRTMTRTDEFGVEWRIEPDSGKWQRREGDDWLDDDPAVYRPPTIEEADSIELDRPARTGGGLTNWLQENWGWVAVAGVGVILVGVIVLVIQIVIETPRPGGRQASSPPGGADQSAGEAAPTSAPVDINQPPTPTTAPTAVSQDRISDGDHTMILIPAGPFRMGASEDELEATYDLCRRIFVEGNECDNQDFETETPAHTVTLDGYYIDQFEVTNAQYASFLNEADNRVEGGASWLEANDAQVRIVRQGGEWVALPDYADHPVTEVTWFGAKAYCEWRGGRLPTEAEWEKAARWNPETDDVRYYPWGDMSPNNTLANYLRVVGGTASVGSFPAGASPSGLLDMAGNVFEWVSDWYDPDYYQAGDMSSPAGPSSGEQKVIRGGSWGDYPFLMHASNRGAVPPMVAFNFIGFRCVKDADQAGQ